MKTILDKLQILTSIVILLVVVIFGYWSVRPYEPFVQNKPHTVLNSPVTAGETLKFMSDVCRNETGRVEVQYTLEDGVLFALGQRSFDQVEVGCSKFINETVTIPVIIPTGEYRLRVDSTIKVNPIRSVTVTFYTDKFNVIQ